MDFCLGQENLCLDLFQSIPGPFTAICHPSNNLSGRRHRQLSPPASLSLQILPRPEVKLSMNGGKALDGFLVVVPDRAPSYSKSGTILTAMKKEYGSSGAVTLEKSKIDLSQQTRRSSPEDGFFDYLMGIDCSDVEVYSISEGYVVFPKVPLMRVEGPVAVVQLLETPIVNLVNYASLVTTNAARHRLVAGKSKSLLEFGLRRAQGPDGGISASKYCYIGGFDATR